MIIKSIFFSKGQMHMENHDLELSSLNFCRNFLGLRARRILAILRHFKIECRRKVTKCGFGSNAQSDPGVYGSEVPYHSCCLPYRVGFWVGPLGYSGPFSFWGSFLPIFSHFLNGSGSKNILDMAQTQNQKSKPSS